VEISELSGVIYRVNSTGPRTAALGTPQTKGIAFEKEFLIFYLLRMSGSR